jgi:hypothetical protein
MSPTKSFITAWFAENYYFEGYPAPPGKHDPQSEYMAQDCFEAAAEVGISRQEIAEEIGDLTEYMRGALARGADEYVSERAEGDD